MVELVGAAAANDGDLVDDAGKPGEHLGELRPALAVAGKLELRPENRRVGADEGVALAADDLRRDRLSLDLGELRLVVEKFELARRPGHEQLDHRLGLPREVRRLGGEGPGGSPRPFGKALPGEQSGQRHLADPEAAIGEEMTPRGMEEAIHRFTTVSSRFITALATSIQAARSIGSPPPSPPSFVASSSPAASRSR